MNDITHIELIDNGSIRITFQDGSFLTDGDFQSILLFKILAKLEEIRCGLIDIEEKK